MNKQALLLRGFYLSFNSYKIKYMDFKIKAEKETPVSLARKIGYKPIAVDEKNEYSIVRLLANRNYPRFHIYLKKNNDIFFFSLHLDQKQPSYKGSNAHSGEYEGDIVENEAERIKKLCYN